MQRKEYLTWFEGLVERSKSLPTHKVITGMAGQSGYMTTQHTIRYDPVKTREWTTEAGTALSAVFPPGHSCRKDWERDIANPNGLQLNAAMFELIGIFKGATNLLREGRLTSLISTIRAETEGELLDQSDELVQTYPAAAAVIAGGALETHLRQLVLQNNLTIHGNGSIDKYNSLIAQARNSGNEIYSANVGKQIVAWGGIRNDAAHTPANFEWTREDVKRLIEGIRGFIDRVT